MSGDWLTMAIALAAVLYAFVGHGGASAYLAVMALAGFAPADMRVTALTMNIAVSAVAGCLFFRNFEWRLLWPFAVTAVPCAWLGGRLHLPPQMFALLVGAALLVASVRLFLPENHAVRRPANLAVALAAGAVMGFVSGLVGVGGGIFLTPLLILAGWAVPRQAAAVSAVFIFLNSLAGLAGMAQAGTMGALPEAFPAWLLAAICGGFVGAHCGSRRARPAWLRPALGIVLVIAAIKFGGQALL